VGELDMLRVVDKARAWVIYVFPATRTPREKWGYLESAVKLLYMAGVIAIWLHVPNVKLNSGHMILTLNEQVL
jgi:hypothetical protein